MLVTVKRIMSEFPFFSRRFELPYRPDGIPVATFRDGFVHTVLPAAAGGVEKPVSRLAGAQLPFQGRIAD